MKRSHDYETSLKMTVFWDVALCSLVTFTLKMATVMFTETVDNSQHSTRLIPESRSYT
jgi:hypothetical protein